METNWILTIGIDKFKLTDEEKERYLEAVNKGIEYIMINGNILTTKFQTLVLKKKEETDKVAKLEAQCPNGKIHNAECDCMFEWIQVDGATYKQVPITEKLT